MIAIYKGAICIALVTIEELLEMTGAQLQGTVTEFVQASII